PAGGERRVGDLGDGGTPADRKYRVAVRAADYGSFAVRIAVRRRRACAVRRRFQQSRRISEMANGTRTERDPLGTLEVPADALYGVQTLRAVQNFPISGLRPLEPFVTGQVWIKKAAALTHRDTGRLDAKLADAIVQAADEVLGGQHMDQFVVDPYQAGAGTSHNMNANEVLANRANEILGGERGTYTP